MKKVMLAMVGLLLTTLLFGCTIKPEVPVDNVSSEYPGVPIEYDKLGNIFAIANEEGDQLITFTPIKNVSDIETLTLAIGENGQSYTIEYAQKQDKNNQDSGRIIASNFNNMEGYIYNVLGKKVVSNQTYFISNKELISEKNLLKSTLTEPKALSTDEKAAISEVKGKIVQDGWILADYGDGIQLQVAVFKPEGQNYLMCFVMKTIDGSLKFMDYPAVSDGQSVWRVDDGGKIDPSLLSILFAARTDKGVIFILSWAGAEGENTFILLEQTDKLKEQPEKAYRYWSPA